MTSDQLLEIPFTDPTPRYYDQAGRTASNPTELIGARPEPDPAAIFSVLSFGAVVPPRSPWEGVRRFIPGFRYLGISNLGPLPPLEVPGIEPLGLADRALRLERSLDRVLTGIIGQGPDPAVLFSGGADSGLIASRLAALGRGDSLLLNFSFGPDDREPELARQMAQHLGLRYERFTAEDRELCDCLVEPGRIYPQPFTDATAAHAFHFAHALIDRLSGERRPILDGTGADGAFGMGDRFRRWGQMSKVPHAARNLAARLYPALWRRPTPLDNPLRALRRLALMPEPAALVARNPLAGILYDAGAAGDVFDLIEDWVEAIPGGSFARRASAAYLGLQSANVYAQNLLPVLARAGHQVHFPYLDLDMVGLGWATLQQQAREEPKAMLKFSLAQHLPQESVYRPRQGFADPRRRVVYQPQFIHHLRAALDSSGPLGWMLHQQPLNQACDLLRRGAPLPRQTLGCLWGIAFLDRWYRTAL